MEFGGGSIADPIYGVARCSGKPLLHSIEIDIDLLEASVCWREHSCRSYVSLYIDCLTTNACYSQQCQIISDKGMLIVKLLQTVFSVSVLSLDEVHHLFLPQITLTYRAVRCPRLSELTRFR